MDIGKSITFALEDEDALTKLGLGAIVSAFPVLNFAWTGYLVDLIRNVERGDPTPLPDWTDLGDKFVRGLIVSVAMFIYFLPAFLSMCLAFFSFLTPAFASGSDSVEEIAILGSGLGLMLFCCMGLYALIMSFFIPAVFINYARKGTLASCFHIGEVFGVITSNPGNYLTACLVTLAVGMVGGLVVSMLVSIPAMIPCIGIFAAWAVGALSGVYMSVIYAHLFGQVDGQAAEL